MYLKTREIAFTGVLAALGVLFVVLGGYLDSSTLFFLALAAFLEGVILRCFSPAAAGSYLAAVFLLGLLLAPVKSYVCTFLAFGLYILAAERLELHVQKRRLLRWLCKGLIFHALVFGAFFLIVAVFGMEISAIIGEKTQDFILNTKYFGTILAALLLEAGWIAADRLYFFLMRRYEGWFRHFLC